jgi:hypothetical protein
MFCKNCPKKHITVMRPDVSCQGNCGTLIKWYNKYCNACATQHNKCEECGNKAK